MSLAMKENELEVTFLAYQSDCWDEKNSKINFLQRERHFLPMTASQNHPTSHFRYPTEEDSTAEPLSVPYSPDNQPKLCI